MKQNLLSNRTKYDLIYMCKSLGIDEKKYLKKEVPYLHDLLMNYSYRQLKNAMP